MTTDNSDSADATLHQISEDVDRLGGKMDQLLTEMQTIREDLASLTSSVNWLQKSVDKMD